MPSILKQDARKVNLADLNNELNSLIVGVFTAKNVMLHDDPFSFEFVSHNKTKPDKSPSYGSHSH